LAVDLVLNNARAYLKNRITECSLAIDKGRILKIGKEANMPKAETKLNLRNLVVLPGLIDAHVHLRDERKAYKEDFFSGTAAAAAGGVTTVLDMPNNDPVTMSAETLRNRMKIAEKSILVNVGFYSEFPRNMEEMKEIVAAGAVGFKLFMTEQVGGLDIDDDNALLEAFRIASRLRVPIAVHAEDKTTLEKAEDELKRAGRNDIDAFLCAHSENVEVKAVKRLLKIAKQAGACMHFCHTSTRDGLKAIVEAKKNGMPVTCEATPHHLFLSTGDLKRAGTAALTMPPIREEQQAAALLDGTRRGWIDNIGSDHAPHTLAEKRAKTVWNVKVGIPGLETMLPLLLANVKKRRLALTDLVKLTSERPAGIFNLKDRGALKEGNHADLTVVDLDRRCRIDSSAFHSKAKFSPFDGFTVEGKPTKTFVEGQLIMDDGEIVAKAGSGNIVRGK
jgi:dihydroorotase (multifunctional complex type)